jgi:hypothetical protein
VDSCQTCLPLYFMHRNPAAVYMDFCHRILQLSRRVQCHRVSKCASLQLCCKLRGLLILRTMGAKRKQYLQEHTEAQRNTRPQAGEAKHKHEADDCAPPKQQWHPLHKTYRLLHVHTATRQHTDCSCHLVFSQGYSCILAVKSAHPH